MRLLLKPQVREGGVWQPSSRPQVARRKCSNSRSRKISRTSRFKERALAVAFVESPILLKLGRRLLASTNSPRPLCLGRSSLMLKGPYRELSAKLLSPMSVHHRPVEVVGVKVFGQSTSSAFHIKRYSQVLCGSFRL